MYNLLEILFIAGVLCVGAAVLLALWFLIRRRFRKLWIPLAIGLGGVAIAVSPAVYTQAILQVDLGPREAIVDGERHLSLTGWDGSSYAFLQTKPDTVVLQMANADVTDETLRYLSNMHQLRELDLNDTKVTDVGLSELSVLPALEVLRLRGTAITDQGFSAHLMELATLRNLDLRGTSVSSEAVEAWKSLRTGRRAMR